MPFPDSPSFPVRVYEIESERPVDDDFTHQIRRVFEDLELPAEGVGSAYTSDGRVHKSRLPPSTKFRRRELWGWAYPDEVALVVVGGWYIWRFRHWTKHPPTRTVSAMVQARVAEWCQENKRERAPRVIRVEIREALEEQVLADTLPEVGGQIVMLNPDRRILLVPGLSDNQARVMADRCAKLLRQVFDDHRLALREWTLRNYLRTTRPLANLPAGLGAMFARFLADQARNEMWAVFRDLPGGSLAGNPTAAFQLTLNAKLKLQREDESLAAKGDHTCEAAMRLITSDADDLDISEVALTLTDHRHENYEVRLDDNGIIRTAKLPQAAEADDGSEDLETVYLERGELALRVALFVRMLMYAFDLGPLQRALVELPGQLSFWPGQAASTRVEWYENCPSLDSLGVNLLGNGPLFRRASDPVKDLVDKMKRDGITMTVEVDGGSVTVGADAARDAARRLEEPREEWMARHGLDKPAEPVIHPADPPEIPRGADKGGGRKK